MRANQAFALGVAKRMYEQGYSLRSIGAQLQCTRETVRQWLLYAGVKLRGRGGPNAKGKHWTLNKPRAEVRKENQDVQLRADNA